MDDPTQIKPGDVVVIKEGDYPGICMAINVGDHDGDHTRITYKRFLGPDLREKTGERERVTKLRYMKKIDRRQMAVMFEAIRKDLDDAERIVSDAMFEGVDYVKRSNHDSE